MAEIKLYNEDCMNILKTMASKSIDLIITDPPYGMNYYSGHYKNGNPHKPIIGDNKYPSDLIPIFKEKARKAIFSFCRWDNLATVPSPNSFIVWIKNNWTAGDLKKEMGRQWEGILFYALENFKFNKRIPDIIDYRRIPPMQLFHPTEKPVGIIKYILENCSQKDDLIFDPFMGSGTTGVACKELNRNFIGVEISKDYYDIAEKRIAEATQNLF